MRKPKLGGGANEIKFSPPVYALACLITLSSMSVALAQDVADRSASTDATLPKNKIVATIPLGTNVFPTAMVVSPDSKSVYVTDFTSTTGMVTVIDTATNTVTSVITIGSNPFALTITPDGNTLYAANDTSVTVISTVSKTVRATVNVAFPMGLAASPDGTKIYVCTPSQKSVSIIDTVNNHLLSNAINASGYQIVVTPNGTSGYLISGNDLYVVDLVKDQLVATIQLPLIRRKAIPDFLTMGFDGAKLFITTRQLIFTLDTSSGRIIRKIGMPISPGNVGQPAVTPDGKFLYDPFTGGDDVVMVDTVSNEIAGTPIKVNTPQAVSIAPDGAHAYFMGTYTTGNGSFEGRVSVVDIRPN
jgi:YVTN family beta-propeller protein